jgi:hypothetical protein
MTLLAHLPFHLLQIIPNPPIVLACNEDARDWRLHRQESTI